MSRSVKNWIKEYLTYTEHSESPEEFHFWTAVSTIAGALRRHVWIDMGYFSWSPNFFVFFVAPPGIVNKSTTGSIGMDLLRELGTINFGPSAGTWQAMIMKMTECGEEFPLPDGTYMPMTAMTLVISELGTFIDPGNREQIDVLVDLWDGKQGVWQKSTKMDGDEEIVNPWINILGFTTPAWIAENFSDYFAGGGFMSRSIFVYAERKRKLVAYPAKHLPKDFLTRRAKLIHDLGEIAKICGAYEMTDEATSWGEKWYEEHYEPGKHKHLSAEKFGGYLARKQTHIHKLAMVLAASERNELTITKEDLSFANDKVTQLEEMMPKMFGAMGREREVLQAAEVLTHLRNKGGMPRAELYRYFMRTMTFDTFEKILRSLTNSALVSTPVKENVIYIIPSRQKKESSSYGEETEEKDEGKDENAESEGDDTGTNSNIY